VLDYENLIVKAHDSWADYDNSKYKCNEIIFLLSCMLSPGQVKYSIVILYKKILKILMEKYILGPSKTKMWFLNY
jgi:hypothetical protein